MTIDEISVVMNAFVAIGTVALAVATFYSIRKLEYSNKIDRTGRILNEIRTKLTNSIIYFNRMLRNIKDLIALRESAIKLMQEQDNSNYDDEQHKKYLLIAERVHHETEKLAEQVFTCEGDLNPLNVLLYSLQYSTPEFAFAKQAYWDASDEYRNMADKLKFNTGQMAETNSMYMAASIEIIKKYIKSMQDLEETCIIAQIEL